VHDRTPPHAELSSAGKREMLAKLLRQKQRKAASAVPASPPQRRMWFLEQLDQGTPLWSVCTPVRLRGELDEAALQRAITRIVRRHDSLRTTFAMVDGTLVQRVVLAAEVPLPTHDLSMLSEEDRPRRADELMHELNNSSFDLANGPMLRTELIRLSVREHILAIWLHHIVFDGWSRGLFLRELATCYAAYRRGEDPVLPELPLQYPEYAVRLAKEIEERLEPQLDYWSKQLADVRSIEVPGSLARPAKRHWRGAGLVMWFPDGLGAALTELSRQNQTTLFATMLAGFQTLVSRYTGVEDVAVASPIAGRRSTDLESMIGLLMNTLVLRTDLSGDPTVTELLARTRHTAFSAYANQDVPFQTVVEELRPQRDLGPLYFTELMFVVQNLPAQPFELAGLGAEWIDFDVGTAKSDLQLTVGTVGDRLACRWVYRTDRYERADIDRFHRAYVALLQSFVADPAARISQLSLGEAEASSSAGIGHVMEVPGMCLHDVVSGHAVRTPDAPAVDDGARTLTYAQLDAAANIVARELLSVGIGRGDLVGIHADRTAGMTAAVLGVLKVGAAYVPLDPYSPQARLRELCAEAGLALVLTDSGVELGVPVREIGLHEDSAVDPVRAPVGPDDLAYVLFTSGSTGKPKGVAVPHGAVLNYLVGIESAFGLPAGASYGMVQPLAVDSSVIMLWGALLAGGLLVLIDKLTTLDGPALARRLAETPVDCLKIAPSHLSALQDGLDPAQLMPRRWLSIGGEASQWEWAAQLAGLEPDCRVFNHYGPTEATVGVLTYPVEADQEPRYPITPLGGALANVQVRVLDRHLRPVPAMVPGELFISGNSIAVGYHRQPALTAEAFLPNPFSGEPGTRMYRTGDLARWRPDGTLEFLGRLDDQIKIQGNRVEPAEVAAVLRRHSDVREAIVDASANGSDPQLVAYVTSQPGATVDPTRLREFAAEALPEHMVPARVVPLAALPLTAHGKLDKAALPAPDYTRGRDSAAPSSDVVAIRASEIFAEVLGVDKVAVADNFFELGGNSLQATRLLARLSAEFAVRVPIRELFAHPTPASFAATIEPPAGRARESDSAHVAVRFGRDSVSPLTFWPHPVSGAVGCYLPISKLLEPDFSLVGLQSADLDGGGPPDASIEELAAIYLEVVHRAQPDGVYRLAGWSMGGLVAFEMARQLRTAGHQVAPLILVDSSLDGSPAGGTPVGLAPGAQAAQFAAIAAANDGDPLPARGPEFLADIAEDDIVPAIRDWLIEIGTINESVPASVIGHRLRVFRANVSAMQRYRGGTYNGRVVLIQAADSAAVVDDRADRWERLIPHLVTHVLPGDHFSLLREPHSTALAALVCDVFSSTG